MKNMRPINNNRNDWTADLRKKRVKGKDGKTIKYVIDPAYPLNLTTIITRDPAFRHSLAYDTFKNQLQWTFPVPLLGITEPRRCTDADFPIIMSGVSEKHGVKFSLSNIKAGLASLRLRRTYDSLIEFVLRCALKHKKPSRSLLTDWIFWLGVEPDELSSIYAKKFIRGMVMRAIKRHFKFDNVLCIQGNQGLGKSMFLQALAGREFFKDGLSDLRNKDSLVEIQGKWLIEIGENDAFGRAGVNRLKQFITKESDSFRPPYGAESLDFPRRTVFTVTTNQAEFLDDTTGNRRFWPVLSVNPVNVAGIKKHREELFACVLDEISHWKNGVPEYYTWLNDKEYAISEARTEDCRNKDAWEDPIKRYLAGKTGFVSTEDICIEGLQLEYSQQRKIGTHISKIMETLPAWKKHKETTGFRRNGYIRIYD